ncbi:MAG: hypothetical protein RJB11_1484, partial [Planctomycetota bacterium]|jgi:hypothetical protein
MVARSAICAWFLISISVCFEVLPMQSVQAQPNNAVSNSPLNFYGDGFVLLQHGAVIHGFIKPQADSVTVVMDKGKQVTLVKKQILFIGPTMESLYKYQTRAIRKWGTGEHWHLAQWCIQNGMLDQAIEHYLELEKQAGDNPKFKQLDLQLKQALLADEDVRRAMAQQGIEPPTIESHDKKNHLASNSGQVVQASVNVPKSMPHADKTITSEEAFPIHAVPGYLRRSFQTEVTPIVVSRCGQSGCHGILSKNQFQVFQPVGQQAASLNERNLENVLRFIDADRPDQSDLLHFAVKPHGTQRNASFNLQREEDRLHLDRISKWIQSLDSIKSKVPSETQPNAVVQANHLATAESPPAAQSAVASSAAKLSKPAKTGAGSVVIDAGDLAEIEEEIRKLEKIAKNKPKDPADPFDAKIFNSKHKTKDLP